MNSNPYLEQVLVRGVAFNEARRAKAGRVDRLVLSACLLSLAVGATCLSLGGLSGWTSLYLGGVLGFVACPVLVLAWLCPWPFEKLDARDIRVLAQMCEIDPRLAAAVRQWRQSDFEVTAGDLKAIRAIFGGPLDPDIRLANAELDRALRSA